MSDGVIPTETGIRFHWPSFGPRLCRVDGRLVRGCRGFSLIELLTAVAIFSLLLGFGVPSYRDWIASRELANHAEYLAETLNLARSEAVKRQSRVNVCKSSDGKQCTITGTWTYGPTKATFKLRRD